MLSRQRGFCLEISFLGLHQFEVPNDSSKVAVDLDEEGLGGNSSFLASLPWVSHADVCFPASGGVLADESAISVCWGR